MPRFSWRRLNATGIVSRSSHEVSTIGRFVYLHGGEHVARTPIDSEIFQLDVEQEQWKRVDVLGGTAPSPRIAHGQAVVGDKIYVFGGRQGVAMGEGSLNDLYYFDTTSSTWHGPIDTSNPPPVRSYHKMISVGTKLYVFGGCGEVGRHNDFHVYDTESNSWEALPDSPLISGRGGPSLVASKDGSKIFLSTGYSGYETCDIHVFSIAERTWRQIASVEDRRFTPRSVCASCRLGNYFVIFGGEVSVSEIGHAGAGDFVSDIVTINMETEDIQTSESAPSELIPRGWTSMTAISESSAVLVGGLAGDDANPMRLDDTWLLEMIEE